MSHHGHGHGHSHAHATPEDAAKWNAMPAKFTLNDSSGELRLQCFLTVRDEKERIALVKLKDYDGWTIPGETMRFNEAPDEAVARVAMSWFEVPPQEVWLERVLSFRATSAEDNRWYLIFLYGAKAPADLKPTSDTEQLVFQPVGSAPGPFAMAHADVWNAL